MDLDGNQILKPTNVDKLKKYYVWERGRRMGGHHFSWPYTLLFPFDIQIIASTLSFVCASKPFFLIVLLILLHWDRGPLVYACFIYEFHEFWAYGRIFLSLFFLPSHYCIPSYRIGCVLHFFFFVSYATCSASSFLHLEWWYSLVHYMEDGHIICIIYTMDIDLKTLSLRRSFHWRDFMLL